MKKATELIFIPIPGIGHIVSTVEIAELLLSRDDNLSITVLVMKFPFNVDGTDAYIESLSKQQRINFVNLPQQQFREPGVMGFFTFADQYIPAVKDTVTKLVESDTSRVSAFVVDMFCTSMIDVANELGLPTYIFYTSGAADLGLMFHLQVLRDEHGKDCTEFKDTVETELVVPSFVHPLPAAKVLPSIVFDKVSGDSYLDFSKRYRQTKGILVNTFLELEPHALRSLSSDDNIPPVYPVGPILSVNSSQEGSDEKSKLKSDVLEWLDDQPPSSVVFLCFGSMGCFGVEQVKEIATALDQSGFRFLWSLRQPPDDSDTSFPRDYADYGRVLPEGFLERTADRGKVIGWAPQVAILAHSSIGGFVSHCGWNSTLESIWFGVPIAAWPLYAEQQLNAFELVEELKLAVEIDVGYRRGSGVIVSRSEIERGIKELMESDSEVRKRVKEMSEMSRKSMLQGGSSYTSLGCFIDQIQSFGQCNSYAKPNLSNLNLNLNLNLKVS